VIEREREMGKRRVRCPKGGKQRENEPQTKAGTYCSSCTMGSRSFRCRGSVLRESPRWACQAGTETGEEGHSRQGWGAKNPPPKKERDRDRDRERGGGREEYGVQRAEREERSIRRSK